MTMADAHFENWGHSRKNSFLHTSVGRTNTTRESLSKEFNSGSRRTVDRVLTQKLHKVRDAVLRHWPRFVSYEEDIALRSDKWTRKYGEKRVIFWDDTNVLAPDPSDADMNGAWFSHYYDGCVAKGAVFLQLCGWMGTWELWAGAISDTDYQEMAGVLSYQAEFVKNCKLHPDIAFLNILDKGYRCVMAAWRRGRQMTLQPDFAKSDRRFTSQQIKRSGAVASHRSGNERAVNVSKRSGVIARGLHKHQNTSDIADAWLCWGFQANFMYKKVLA